MIECMQMMADDQRVKIIQSIKLHMGMTYFLGLRDYAFKKVTDETILKYMK